MKKLAKYLAGAVAGTTIALAGPALANGHHANPCEVPPPSEMLGISAYYWSHGNVQASQYANWSNLPTATQLRWEITGVHVLWKACHPDQTAPWPNTLPLNN